MSRVNKALATYLQQMFGQIKKDRNWSDPFNSIAVIEEKDPEYDGDEEGTRVGSCGQEPSNFENWNGLTLFFNNTSRNVF